MKVSTKELRTRTKLVLDAVARGEEVVITYRGKVRAKMVAAGEKRTGIGGDELFGIWGDYDKTTDVEAYVDQIRRARV